MRLLVLFVLSVAFAVHITAVSAGERYIRSPEGGPYGRGDGADWENAFRYELFQGKVLYESTKGI